MNTLVFVPEFLDKGKVIDGSIEVDARERQLKELYLIENPSLIQNNKEETWTSEEFKNFVFSKKEDFVSVYYPWNNTTLHTLGEESYFKIKTNRNRDLITEEEQRLFYQTPIAVLGLSVGSNIAFTLSQAGISKSITVADFDELDTSNLNRIFAGAHQIGMPKWIIATRHIYEDNPFAQVTPLSEGVTENNLEPLLQSGKIKIIIEEVDMLPIKIRVRQLAMNYKVPVVMVTDNGDGVVLHIERYDLGHDKIFGEPFSFWQDLLTSPLPKEAMGKLIMEKIVGGMDKVDQRMIMSVGKVLNKQLVSWSQLGSAAALAGVVATVAVKQILRKESVEHDVRAHVNFPIFN